MDLEAEGGVLGREGQGSDQQKGQVAGRDYRILTVSFDPNDTAESLAKFRAARKEKQEALAAAQDNLKNVLTARQEAAAVLMGLLP